MFDFGVPVVEVGDEDGVDLHFVWQVAQAHVGVSGACEPAEFFAVESKVLVEVVFFACFDFDDYYAVVELRKDIDLHVSDSEVAVDDGVAFCSEGFGGELFAGVSDVFGCHGWTFAARKRCPRRQ